MNTIAYVLATREIFVTGPDAARESLALPATAAELGAWSAVSGATSAATSGVTTEPHSTVEPRLITELRRLGWPAQASLRGPRAGAEGPVTGVLVELIDALPILAAPTDEEGEGAELTAYRQAARLALDLVASGAALPRLRARDGGRRGWDARWRASVITAAQRAKLVRLGELLPATIAVPIGSAWTSTPLTGQRLLYRMLDACTDMLVREASRRGAMVRLGHWPAGAWEQQLVRALGEERATFRVSDPATAEAIAKEVNDWVQDQLDAAALSLLPSPALWTAPETLTQVVSRLLAPAAQLALTLRSGRPAPRMLPTTTWLPRKTSTPTLLVRQAAA